MKEENKSDTEVTQILSFIETTALTLFVHEYATTHADFKNALKQRFAPPRNNALLQTDYRKEIEFCFSSSSYRGRYRGYGGYSIDLDEISRKLDVFWKKADYLMDQKSFGDVASIALQVLHSIGTHFEDDQYEACYDDYCCLESDCEMAGNFLLRLACNEEVFQSVKDDILEELSAILPLGAYRAYNIYDVDKLIEKFELDAESPLSALRIIKEKLVKNESGSWRKYELVLKKVALLNALDRQVEAKQAIQNYISLPEIRAVWVEELLQEGNKEEALDVLDKGICQLKQSNDYRWLPDWKCKKLEIYQLANDKANIVKMARELFVDAKGKLEYYHLLKQNVNASEWTLFLKGLLEETPFFARGYFYDSDVIADIYAEEKDYVRLMNCAKQLSGRTQLEFLLVYACHLKDTYAEEILNLFSVLLQEYAEKNVGRDYYEYITKVLRMMLTVKGGEQAVRSLVDIFRVSYKRRSSMMATLAGF